MRQRDRGDGRPRCFDGAAPSTYLANNGYDAEGRLQRVEIPWAFSRECKSWAADPSTDPVPMTECWRCLGCRHYPSEAIKVAVERKVARERPRT